MSDRPFSKNQMIEAFILQLGNELVALKRAALASYEDATHEETKPENQYDTRALEASYLAGAQAKRVQEIDEILSNFKQLPVRNFTASDPISISALVDLETGGKKSRLILMPKGGGQSLDFEGQKIRVITPNSILGEALIGMFQGDRVSVEIGARTEEYAILQVQ